MEAEPAPRLQSARPAHCHRRACGPSNLPASRRARSNALNILQASPASAEVDPEASAAIVLVAEVPAVELPAAPPVAAEVVAEVLAAVVPVAALAVAELLAAAVPPRALRVRTGYPGTPKQAAPRGRHRSRGPCEGPGKPFEA